jgi:hypothetical protein
MAARTGPLVAGLTLAAGLMAGCAGPAMPLSPHAGTAGRVPDIVRAAHAGGESGPHLRFGGSGSVCMCGHGPNEKQIEAAEARLRAGKAGNRTPSATSKN